jgi:hypothetical protein
VKRVRMSRHIPNYVRDGVESAVARGLGFDQIMALGFTRQQVERVMAGMDEANSKETVPQLRTLIGPEPA